LKVKCIIVDDEPPARELMASYLSKLDDFDVTAQFGNALEAFTYLQGNEIDLMLLDIQMPNMNGLELIKSLRRPPRTILTTAFREYAIDGFELDVIDYLVKPISFERFMKAIGKYHQFFPKPVVDDPAAEAFDNAYIFIKVDKHQVKLLLRDIVYMESIKDYLRVVTDKKSYVIYHRLSSMEEKLPEDHFVRVHKSFIVSVDKIKSYRNEKVNIGEKKYRLVECINENFWICCTSNRINDGNRQQV
jgi:DNA-binding LytR/AlgR family response regulator